MKPGEIKPSGQSARNELLRILGETRAWLARPGTNFDYYTWDSTEEALREFDALVAGFASGRSADDSEVALLFSPTGSMQELSMSSGWREEFLDLARRFDEALARHRRSLG